MTEITIKELERAKLEAEIDTLKAHKRKHSADARVAEADARERERDEKTEVASEFENQLYTFIGNVDSGNVKSCMQTLGRISRRDPECDLTIVFNSPGGSVFDGLALFDYLTELKASGHHITTVTRGMAASMGGILLQAGDERIIGQHSHLLIHEISSLGIGKLSEMEDEVKFVKRLCDRLVGILSERSTLTEGQIKRRWSRKDWWLDADETVEFGFADKIG